LARYVFGAAFEQAFDDGSLRRHHALHVTCPL
jgi:hypothetical protein